MLGDDLGARGILAREDPAVRDDVGRDLLIDHSHVLAPGTEDLDGARRDGLGEVSALLDGAALQSSTVMLGMGSSSDRGDAAAAELTAQLVAGLQERLDDRALSRLVEVVRWVPSS